MNLPTLMTKIAALRGHPLAVSSMPAPRDTDQSDVLEADVSRQIGATRNIRIRRNIEFVRYPGAGRNRSELVLRLDVMAQKTPGTRPLVVYIPGGGFVVAPKMGGSRLRAYVAAAGYVVASVEYRTTRHGATYVDGIADVRAAIAFLRAHADEYGIDGSRVAVWGESAGGYLAAMVGVTDRHASSDPNAARDILAVIDKFGGSSLERIAEGFDDATIAAADVPGNPVARYVHGPDARFVRDNARTLRAADPVSHAGPDSPPFLLFHGADDRIISPVQTAVLHRALRAAGADSTRYLVNGAGHGDIAVKSGEEKYWTTEPMMRIIVDFLDRTLGA